MKPQFELVHYQRDEVKMALVPLLFLGLGVVSQIPRDWMYLHEGLLLGLITGLRLLVGLVIVVTFFSVDTKWGRKYYLVMTTLIWLLGFVVGFSALVTRPPDQLFDFLLTMTAVTYYYFLLPAPLVLKVLAGSTFSLLCLWSVYFLKSYTLEQAALVTLSFGLLNLMGPIVAWWTGRFRLQEFARRRQQDREAEFKAALADVAFDALVIPEGDTILDFNQGFLDLVDMPPWEVRGEALSSFLMEDRLQCKGGVEVPVEVRTHDVVIGGLVLTGYLIRDKSRDDLKLLRGEQDLTARVEGLPLSKREKEIVTHIVEGHTRYRIADDLFISDETVKKHTGNIYRKLGLTSKTDLIKRLMGNPGSTPV